MVTKATLALINFILFFYLEKLNFKTAGYAFWCLWHIYQFLISNPLLSLKPPVAITIRSISSQMPVTNNPTTVSDKTSIKIADVIRPA